MIKKQQTQNLKTKNHETENHETKNATTLPVIAAPETLAQLDADVAALAAEANELSDDYRVGDDLKFKKGKWTKSVGDKDIEIGGTMTFAVDVLSYKRGWIKWVDRKPVHKLIGRPVDGFVSPVRDRLDDNNENRWPRNSKGEPQDPWQETFSIVKRDLSDGRLCTFTTTSYYGSRALGALLKTYTRDVKKHPGMMPVVLLLSETRPTTNYGDVEAPLLKVVDWQPFGDDASPPGMKLLAPTLPKVQQVLPPPSKQTKTLGDDMSDEVPF
jgi:hypothetical protein